MLHFIQSNKLEKLFDRLSLVLASTQQDPLQPVEIIVQNPGMGRWLSQQIAIREGIAANLRFPLPARFIWQVLAGQLDELDEQNRDFDRSVLVWRIMEEICILPQDDIFTEIRNYLQGDLDGRRRFHLAAKIADIYDQYLVYRPKMLLQWESGAGDGWQSALWRRLTSSSKHHRARYLEQFLNKARHNALDPDLLPSRVFLFGISSLAPVYLHVIEAISTLVDVYLFHLSPCREYWEDIMTEADMARSRKKIVHAQNETDEYLLTGNPLLASQGKLGREFVNLVSDIRNDEECYEKQQGDSMLAVLQNDILDLVDRTELQENKRVLKEQDRSVQLHSCHSRMREVQVLHDKLLEVFEENPEIKPSDILVMAPVIEEYAPAIVAVFDGAPGEMFIPWSLADRSIRGEDPLADAFLALMELCQGRFKVSEVISFLETTAVLRRFGIEAEELTTVRRWIGESGIRWGLDTEHRREFSQGMDDAHSWIFGLKRLFMGYFTGSDSEIVQGVAPAGALVGSRGELLGRFALFLERLESVRKQFKQEQSVSVWSDQLLTMLDDFFDPGSDEEEQQALAQLREVICSLDEDVKVAGFTRKIQATVIREYLKEALAQPSSGQAFLSGRVTFCNMVPMRSVPFAVICLLGMNDSDYPRRQSSTGFDLMSRNPQPGDRNRRDDDRYLFIEALISARRSFYVSWQGRNQIDNTIRPPSVVVAELMDYIRRAFVTSNNSPPASLEIEHPLQPFSRKCYDQRTESWSFAPQWLPAATGQQGRNFIEHPLAEPCAEHFQLDLQQFLRFWSHPVRYYLQNRLAMNMVDRDEMLEDSETFKPDYLQRYLLLDRFVRMELEGKDSVLQRSQLQAEGLLPHGSFATNYYATLVEEAEALTPRVRPLISNPMDPVEVWLTVGNFTLSGWLRGLYGNDCIRYRPAKLKGRDLLRTWIEHLVFNALKERSGGKSVFVAKDARADFGPVADPIKELQNLLDLYWHGLSMPLQFFPETSWAWFNFGKEKRGHYQAEQKWFGGFMGQGEGEDLAYRIALQGFEPLDEEFERLSTLVWTPLGEHLELTDA